MSQLIHLPCDMLVSGGTGLSDWEIRPLWPFDKAGFVLPLIPWGDVGPTVILMIGAVCLARNVNQRSTYAFVTLLSLGGYMAIRGLMRGAIP